MVLLFASKPGKRSILLSLGLLVLCALPLASCGEDGGECDKCTTDSDCKAGLVCANFNDENGNPAGQHCASGMGNTQCRVR